jgi:DNA (cytosine-5)-methyltransferase 1
MKTSKRKKSYITATDQFCGAGGSTQGLKKAGVEVRLAMNHWKLAIDTYNTNHPEVDIDCTDISAVDPRRYPSTNMLITSPECTNHSLAKGVERRKYQMNMFDKKLIDPSAERSRATMWDVPRFAEYHDYEIVKVENVVDAAKWVMWDSWLMAMHSLGYEHEVVYFNSMFAWPTPQSRDRMYVVFWKKGNKKPDLEFRPLAHCARCIKDVEGIQTWKKKLKWGRYKAQYFYRCPTCHNEVVPYYYAGFNAIDFTIPSTRIGDRKVPLKPKTMERVKYGWDTYGRQVMIVTGRYTSGIDCRVRSANIDVIPTQPGDSSHAVLMPWLVQVDHTQAKGNSYTIESGSPTPTQTTSQVLAVVSGFVTKNYGGGANPAYMSSGLDEPLGTMTTAGNQSLLTIPQLQKKYGMVDPRLINDKDLMVLGDGSRRALLSSKAFMTYYYGTMNASHVADPIHTVSTRDRMSLIQDFDSMSIEDLHFRMLQPKEVGKSMAFDENYKVLGNGREQVKQYGNAVTPPVEDMISSRLIATLQ